MKIYMNNNVYANKSDIMFILCNKIPAPNSFYNVLYHHTDENGTMEFNNDNKNDFVCFYGNDCKNFFRYQDYILNYGTFKNYDQGELYKIIGSLQHDRLMVADYITNLNPNDIEAKNILQFKLAEINHLLNSFYELIEFKNGNSRMILPKKESSNDIKHKAFMRQILSFDPNKYILSGNKVW